MVGGLEVVVMEGVGARGLRGEVVVGEVEVGNLHRAEVGPRAIEVGLEVGLEVGFKGGRAKAAGVAGEGVGEGQAGGGGRNGKVKGKVGEEGGVKLRLVERGFDVEDEKTRGRFVKHAAGVARSRRRRGQTLLLNSWRRPFLQAVDGLNEEAKERQEGGSKGPVVPVA